MKTEKRFLVDVGMRELPFPINVLSRSAPDGQPTDLFFLLCFQDDKLHLHTLARLCLMAQKTDLLADLRSAQDGPGLYGVLIAAEREVVSTLRNATR